MKPGASPIPASLRPLFLAIARASVVSSAAGCVIEHLAEDPDAGEQLPPVVAMDAAPQAPDAALPPPSYDGGVVPDATSIRPDAGAYVDAWVDGSTPDPGDDGIGWQRVPCLSDGYRADLTGVRPSRPTDSVHVYEEGPQQQVFGARYAAEMASVGVACSGAADAAACEQQVATLKNGTSCPQSTCRYVLSGQGGAYERLDRRDQLLALLGSIDAAADALLLAAFDGHGLCPGLKIDPRDVGADVRATPHGYELRITRQECGGELYRDRLTIAPDGTLTAVSHVVLSGANCVVGRRPAGLRSGAAPIGRTRLGAFLAGAAQLEAASVFAFYKLLRELRALGAPRVLRDAALDAMLDEVRHAQDVGELARAYGGEVARPQVEATGLRSAFELALENVGEGCVRETFGALQATYQAETATDPRVRHVMAQIAEDESRHADLAWQLHAWLEPQLSEAERAQVAAERARVLDALAADLDVGLSRDEHAALGFPTPEVSGGMLRSLSQALYA